MREAGTRDSGVRDADTDGSEPRSLVADAGEFSVTAGDAAEFVSLDFPALSLDAASGAALFAARLVPGSFASGGAFPAGGAVVPGAVGTATAGADNGDCAGVTACPLVEVLGVTAGAFEEAVGAAPSRFVTTVFT